MEKQNKIHTHKNNQNQNAQAYNYHQMKDRIIESQSEASQRLSRKGFALEVSSSKNVSELISVLPQACHVR